MSLPNDPSNDPLEREREELLALLAAEEAAGGDAGIQPRPPGSTAPLAGAQEQLWFLQQFDPGSRAYHVPMAVRLDGTLDVAALEWALNEVVRRHEALRTVFRSRGGRAVQMVLPELRLSLVCRPAPGGLTEGGQGDAALIEALTRFAAEAFDLESGPLIRAALFRISAESHALCLVAHHIVVDGWSLGILQRELSAFYTRRVRGTESAPEPPVPRLQPGDFALWEQEQLTSERARDALAFWARELAGPLPVLELPTDRPRPPRQSFRGTYHAFHIPGELCARFRELCQRERVTPFMGLVALYQMLLHRLGGQPEVLVGCASSGRHHPGLENVVGMFVNTVVLRTPLGDELTFAELLRRVREIALRAFEHQEVPFERVVQAVQPTRSLAYHPVFQAGFSHMTVGNEGELRLPGITPQPLAVGVTGAKFDLMLNLVETPGGIDASLEYNTELRGERSIGVMGRAYVELMRGVVGNGGKLGIREYGMVGVEDRERLMEWAGEGRGVEGMRSVWEDFCERARQRPQARGVVGEGRELSYGELRLRALALGRELRRQGVEKEEVVGLYAERGVEWAVGVLGIWAAGGAYVSLDVKTPVERVEYVMRDVKGRVMVTTAGLRERVKGVVGKVVCVEESWGGADEEEERKPGLGDLAYVIYTSGSTGKPKGVAVEHGQLAGYVGAVVERLGLPEWGSYGMVSTVGADLGHTVVYGALSLGGSLHVVSEERATNGYGLGEYMGRECLEVMKIVPSHLEALRSAGDGSRVLPGKKLVLGGESAGVEWVKGLMRSKPGLEVCNHYGPTETTVGAVACRLREEELEGMSGNVPLGRPLRNARVYVLDERRELVPPGVPGELWIGGSGVARGYWGQEEWTRERFVKDPYVSGEGRMYRSGDVVRFLEDGRLEFLGRRDRQVKVRGYRVELGEVESVLKEHEGVRDGVVEVKGGELVGYVVPRDGRGAALSGGKTWRVGGGAGLRVAHVNRNETEYIFREIFELQAYGRHGVRVGAGGVVLDVGANIGMFSVFMNLTVAGVRVYAFEPNPVVYEALRRNLKAYGEEGRSEGMKCGMGRESGEAELTFYEGFSLLSGFHAEEAVEREVVKNYVKNQQRGSGRSEAELEREAEELVAGRFEAKRMKARIWTVGEFMKERGIGEVELLKVNVEKSEREVLEGVGKENWGKIRQVVVEVDVKGHVEPIVELLKGQGYEVEVEQDRLLERTELCYVYGIRPGPKGRLERGKSGQVEVKWPEVRVPEAEELREHVGRRLPEHMVPRRYVYLEKIPLTGNGKVDRGGLPDPEQEGMGGAGVREAREKRGPRNEQERIIAGIWEEVLGVKGIGVQDDFFELGGHSLRATQVVSRISEAFALKVPLRALFDAPSVEGLSRAVDELRAKGTRRQARSA